MNMARQAPATVGPVKWPRSVACAAVVFALTVTGPRAGAQVNEVTPPVAEIRSPLTMWLPVALDRPNDPERPFIGLLRYDEDWSFLKDPAKRTEFWDPVKYISLGRPDWYLSLGGETRQRYEIYHNFPFSPLAPTDPDGYYLMRYMPHADLHLGDSVRVFGQLKSALPFDKEPFDTGADRSELNVNQLFIDFKARLAETADSFTARLGRQELHYGMGRLLTIREGPNNRQGWDGVRGILTLRNWRIDGFFALGVRDGQHVFDDPSTTDRKIWGVYATMMGAFFPGLGIDVYYMGDAANKAFFTREGISYFQDVFVGRGNEVRHSVGTRWFGFRGQWYWDGEGIFQFGEHKGAPIRAYEVSVGGGYILAQVPTSPRVGLGLDFASGDRKATDGDLETFRPIVFRGNYSGEAAFLQLSNVIKVHPWIDPRLRKDMFLFLDFPLFWRMSTEDGLYSPGGFLVADPGIPPTIKDRYVGFQPSAQYTWAITQYLLFNVSYAHFVSGGFLQKAGRGDADFGAIWMTYKF